MGMSIISQTDDANAVPSHILDGSNRLTCIALDCKLIVSEGVLNRTPVPIVIVHLRRYRYWNPFKSAEIRRKVQGLAFSNMRNP